MAFQKYLFLTILSFPTFKQVMSLEFQRRDTPSDGYFNPADNQGSMLTQVDNTSPAGQAEPINIIISANSDSAILVDSADNGGLQNYFQSLHFSGECLGVHLGDDERANLGDGNGYQNQTAVMRWNYGNVVTGTCQESEDGGNHFRYWIQNGSEANSGAVFMAVSYEESAADGHDIVVNGYNLGRDYIVGNITNSTVPTADLTNSSTFSSQTFSDGWIYTTNVSYVSGLLQNTSVGINHNLTVATDGVNAVDGLVAVFQVAITQKGDATSSADGSQSTDSNSAKSWAASNWIFLGISACTSILILSTEF